MRANKVCRTPVAPKHRGRVQYIPRSIPHTTITVKRYVDKGIVNSTSVSDFKQGYYFTLADITTYTNLTALYDSYKFESIHFRIDPVCQLGFPAASYSYSDMFVAIDYDDANSPASVSTLYAYDTVKRVPPGQKFQFTFTPKIALAAYTGAFTGYTSQKASFLDCASSSIQHYGVKIGIWQNTNSNLFPWKISAEYVVTFRRTH
jgi:hypothetical protein